MSKKKVNIQNMKKLTDEEFVNKKIEELKEETEINEDIEEFFEKVKTEYKKTEMLTDFEEDADENDDDEIELQDEPEEIKKEIPRVLKDKQEKKASQKEPKSKIFLLIISFLFAFIYYIIYVKSSFDNINYVKDIINASFIITIFFFIIIALICNKKVRNIFSIFISLLTILLVILNILFMNNKIILPTNKVLESLINMSLTDAMKYASDNNIQVSSTYEFSDNIAEGYVVSQDISEGTLLKKVEALKLIVSSGPSLDKELILSNWVGRTVDDLLLYIKENHLSNVTINFEINNETPKEQIISQSIKGEIKRNSEITFVASLGNKESLKTINIEDLAKKSLFDATLYLKRNGIKYELSYEYSNDIKLNYVLNQTPEKNTSVDPNKDTVKLVISKGKEITVPDFTGKTTDEVIDWIIDNNLKVSFNEKYNNTIEKGKFISINYEKGTKLSEGTKITITTSLGSLKVPAVNSVGEFKSWAEQNGVKYTEKYEYSDSVIKGKIIGLSKKTGEVVDIEKDNITITISYGSPVKVPNFVGKTRNTVQAECTRAGLNCTFNYSGYNNAAKDTALSQNIPSGRQVVSGTYVNITLSPGPAQTFNIFIQSEWFSSSADGTIATLRSKLTQAAPGVTFNFVKKNANSCVPGVIHQDSPIKAGNNYFTQGQTYTIWVMDC